MTPKRFMQLKKRQDRILQDAEATISEARESVVFPAKETLRPANASDIIEGALIFYPHFDDPENAWWTIIDEVLHPNDDFKAFMGDGCRYGLKDAYVQLRGVA